MPPVISKNKVDRIAFQYLPIEKQLAIINLELAFDPSLHPKDEYGKWAKKGGGKVGVQKRPTRTKGASPRINKTRGTFEERYTVKSGQPADIAYAGAVGKAKQNLELHRQKRAAKKQNFADQMKEWQKQSREQENIDIAHKAKAEEYKPEVGEWPEKTFKENLGATVAREATNVAAIEGTSFLGRKLFQGAKSALAKFGIGGKSVSSDGNGNTGGGGVSNSAHEDFTYHPNHGNTGSGGGLIRSSGGLIKSGAGYLRRNPKKALATAILTYAGYRVGSRYYEDYKKRKDVEREEKEDREFHEELKKQTAREIAKNAAIYANQQYIKEATSVARENAAMEIERYRPTIAKDTREITHRATRDFVNYQRKDLDKEIVGEQDPTFWQKIFGRKKKRGPNYSISQEAKKISSEAYKFI